VHESLARVIEARPGVALVEVLGNAGCGQCSPHQPCSVSILSGIFPLRARRFLVQDAIGVRGGDEVVVAIAEGALGRSSAAVYAVALAGVLAGAAGGAWLAPAAADGAAALGAALGLAAAFVAIRRRAAATGSRLGGAPRVIRAAGRAAVSFHR
jgi:sigma-E factor negative regulatory protein RseC